MTKIIIISCIIAAVCVFQTAEAGLLSNLPISSGRPNVGNGMLDMMGNMKDMAGMMQNTGKDNGMLDMMGNVKDMLEKLQKDGMDMINKLTSGLKESMDRLRNSETCMKAHKEGKEAWEKLISNFKSCVNTEIQSANETMKKLMVPLNTMITSVLKEYQEIFKCYQNPLLVVQCTMKVSQDIPKLFAELTPLMEEVVKQGSELIGVFRNVEQCYEKAMKLVVENGRPLINNAKECITSVIEPIMS